MQHRDATVVGASGLLAFSSVLFLSSETGNYRFCLRPTSDPVGVRLEVAGPSALCTGRKEVPVLL